MHSQSLLTERFDVAVIGAGPAGSMAAKYAARSGARTVLLEEHASIGWPVECAGLLGVKAIEESELSLGKFAIRPVKGARVCSPNNEVSFKARSTRAWVVDRKLFDRELALEAVRCGAELRLKSCVRGFVRNGEDCLLKLADGGTVEARVVISAEGVRSRIARIAGISSPQIILSGAEVEAPFLFDDAENVELYFGQETAPGLFAWVIPACDGVARIGLCSRDNACSYLDKFLKRGDIAKRLLGSPVDFVAGGLPLGPPRSTVSDGFMAVGDAAAQVKPTSGGGIYPGLVSAKVAGKVAAAAALCGDSSSRRLQEYDVGWRSLVGKELGSGMKLNRMLSRMTDKELDEVTGYLGRKPKLLMAIEEYGDIDRPSVLAAKMLPHIGLDGVKLAMLLRRAYF